MKANLMGAGILVLLMTVAAWAGSHTASESEDEVAHRLVIQVSTDDPRTQNIALNNAVNLQKHYGIDNIAIEIVAYGPGLKMLTQKSPVVERISSLAQQDITFSACGNTMSKMHEKTGQVPMLIKGVEKVTAGVARILELQEQGYAYVRP